MISLLTASYQLFDAALTCRSLGSFNNLWNHLDTASLALQTVLVYVIANLSSQVNYFNLLLGLLLVIILCAVYVTLYQLELFACFMFVAEFTIVIFFYALFLHLQVATSREGSGNSLAALPAIFLAATVASSWFPSSEQSAQSVYLDFYASAAYVTLNDLGFFYFTVFRSNYTVHLTVGLLLLFLTIFLFCCVNVYFFLNLRGSDLHRSQASNLSVGRGYYENTAEDAQKVLKNSNKG